MASTVLVVDDDDEQASLFHEMLLATGISVLTSSDGRSALELLRRHKIDIVLLDYVLPGLDGLEVCRLVRQMSQQLPRIIIISGMNSDAIKSLALEVGANDYLEKPFETESLLDCVARHMAEAAILREA